VIKMTNEDRPLNSEMGAGNERLPDLHFYAASGDWSGVCEAIRAGQDVNGVDIGKWTPLHWVVDMGLAAGQREEIVTTLIKAGADLEAEDSEGSTPLLRACMAGNEELVRLLIEAGADVATKNKLGWTPFLESVRSGYGPIVVQFLDRGASHEERSPSGETALEMARRIGRDEIVCILEFWNAARALGTDWLQPLSIAQTDETERKIYDLLVATEAGCGIEFWFQGLPHPSEDLLPLKDLDRRMTGEVLWREFVRDWERFLDKTALVLDAAHLSSDLCLIFRGRHRFRGTVEDWAEVQSNWASRNRFRGKDWTKEHFLNSRFDDGTNTAMTRLVGILRKYRR